MAVFRLPHRAPQAGQGQGSYIPLSALSGAGRQRRRRTYRHGAQSVGLGSLGLVAASWGRRAQKSIRAAGAAFSEEDQEVLLESSTELEFGMQLPVTLEKKRIGAAARSQALRVIQSARARMSYEDDPAAWEATVAVQDAFNDAANWLSDQKTAHEIEDTPAEITFDFDDTPAPSAPRGSGSVQASFSRGPTSSRRASVNSTARGTVNAQRASARAVTPTRAQPPAASAGGGALSPSQQDLMIALAIGRGGQPAPQRGPSTGTVVGIAVASVAALGLVAMAMKR